MKKISKLICLLMIAVLTVCLCACGSKKEKKEESKIKMPASDLLSKTIEKVKDFPDGETLKKGDDEDKKWFEYLCEFDYDKVDDFAIKYSVSGTADEFLIIKVKDENDVKALKEALLKRQDTRKTQFKQYDAKEVSKIEAAKIVSSENVVAFIVSDDATDISNALTETIDENK